MTVAQEQEPHQGEAYGYGGFEGAPFTPQSGPLGPGDRGMDSGLLDTSPSQPLASPPLASQAGVPSSKDGGGGGSVGQYSSSADWVMMRYGLTLSTPVSGQMHEEGPRPDRGPPGQGAGARAGAGRGLFQHGVDAGRAQP
ncbi:unnamed protein product [Discosporangium mesarthrocarpum]